MAILQQPYTLPRLSALILLASQAAHAENPDFDGLEDTYGNEKMLSIATGHPIPQKLSPSVTSVLTSEDIEKVGARRLLDVLEYLPGIHVSTARSGNSVIGFRGIYSETNSQVLLLINGSPVRDTVIGGKPLDWTLPVKNISHIEVIRGPGSMLYGGDATTGVINVVLKTGKELHGGNAGGFFGSDDTYEGWAQYGRKIDDWEYSMTAQYGTTNGNRGLIERDAQTFLDNFWGTAVSNAPGYTNNGRDDVDVRFDIAYKDWLRLRAGYQRFNDVQTGQGVALALDNTGTNNVALYNTDLSINHKIDDYLSLESKLYFLGQDTDLINQLLPPGTLGGLLPQGAISHASNFQNTIGWNSQFNYTGFKSHNLTTGLGVNQYWATDVNNKLNYLITPGSIRQIPFTDVAALGGATLNTRNRTNFYALFQDEWNFTPDFFLTTGFRYDYYSDVEAGFSPRVALVWNVDNNLTTKLLYGRSFRPPSFLEKNLPLLQNSDIKSETMNTVEFQIENKWSPKLVTSANVYWFELDNLITSVSDSSLTSLTSVSPNPVGFTNAGTINGIGLETEGRFALSDQLNLAVNYSHHGVSESNQTGLLPEHMVKALINWEFSEGWMLGSQLNWVGERKRPANDPRPNLKGYFIAGLTLTNRIAKHLELTLRANNIFASTAKEPSLNPSLLPGDVPVTDQSVLGQVKWSF